MPLATITDFVTQSASPDRYTRLPDDWWLAVADVIGSTGLAAGGRHRDVNFVAGAAVAVLSKIIENGGHTPCCQFGGDGALAAVPPDRHEAAAKGLAALAWWSINDIDVPIRVGMVQVADLTAAGLDALAAVRDFGGGNVFGLFMGAGVTVAEEWVKNDPLRQLAPQAGDMPGLEGLSCRWTPVPSARGAILCLIIDPVTDEHGTLARINREIETIVDTELAQPLSRQGHRLEPKWPPSLRSIALEARVVAKGGRVGRALKAILTSLLMKVIDLTGRPHLGFDPRGYRAAIAERSDYRKAAGGPRMVLDVTEGEATAIEALLEREVAAGHIHYGLARAASTTITCNVGDFAADRHVHFVDGDGLGFWRAAQALKSRFAKARRERTAANAHSATK